MEKIVLVEPEIPENTGFIARLAENFEADLRIVEPEFNLSEARKTANNSQEKVREARIFENFEDSIRDLEYVVGTKPGIGISINEFQPRKNTSLVLGRESSGLTNEELEKCDAIVHIETGSYSSINLSHAAAIMMHKCFSSEQDQASLENLEMLEDSVGGKTVELLKRASPTEKEVEAVIADIRSRH